jgi:hypothetical protein
MDSLYFSEHTWINGFEMAAGNEIGRGVSRVKKRHIGVFSGIAKLKNQAYLYGNKIITLRARRLKIRQLPLI